MTIETHANRICTPQTAKQLAEGSTACLFNLIVYANHPDQMASSKALMEMVTERFPCRIIFIQREESVGPLLQVRGCVYSTTQGALPDYEEIRISVSCCNLDRVPYVVLPYLLSDLPVFLVWGQDPALEKTVLPSLLHMGDRLIIDSESTENLSRFSQQILKLHKRESLDIVDLNWARISGWREVFRKVFDSPERRQKLAHANRILIHYNQLENAVKAGTQTQALYLQAWLADRFGWHLQNISKNGDQSLASYRHASGELLVSLVPGAEPGRWPGVLLGAEVQGPNRSHFSMKHLPESRQLMVHISSPEACELPFTLLVPGVRRSYPFLKELFYAPGSPQYFTMLHLLAKQDWDL